MFFFKVKHFAKQLIYSLDDGDEAALVTFGKEAEIFFPLTKLTVESRVINIDTNKTKNFIL